jgi:hypothetical protein
MLSMPEPLGASWLYILVAIWTTLGLGSPAAWLATLHCTSLPATASSNFQDLLAARSGLSGTPVSTFHRSALQPLILNAIAVVMHQISPESDSCPVPTCNTIWMPKRLTKMNVLKAGFFFFLDHPLIFADHLHFSLHHHHLHNIQEFLLCCGNIVLIQAHAILSLQPKSAQNPLQPSIHNKTPSWVCWHAPVIPYL